MSQNKTDRNTQEPLVSDDELEAMLRSELAPEIEVVRRLGRGSMATVYLGREGQLKRLVAIKVLSPSLARDERAGLRFEREAQASAALNHPNVVTVFRVGRLSNDLPYMVMEYVRGRTMAERLAAQGPLPEDRARRVIVDVASALAAAHRKGIVHRDVRPGNVLYEEESGRVLLSDFGIAAILASGESGGPGRITRTGELIGDPGYMSPEQLLGETLSELSDVYSLGLLGYELLTGSGPYGASSKREMITSHIKSEPKPLTEARPGTDPVLAETLARCLAKQPSHRPSAADVAKRLETPSGEVQLKVPGGMASTTMGSGLLRRLTERRFPQVIALYTIIGWTLLQVADQLADRGVLPEVMYRLVLVAVLTGLPAVLVGTWYHGKRGRQEFTRVEYWVFALLGLVWVAVSAVILFTWRG